MRRIAKGVPAGFLVSLLLLAISAAETPPGLLHLQPESLTAAPERDWEKLSIRDSELRLLERFHRGGGYEGYHVGYKSGDLNITGILARPYIRDEETKYPAIVLNHGSPSGLTEAYRAITLELARRGYVVVAPTFRGRAGLEGRAQGLVEFAKGEIIDTLQLTQLGRKLEYVDSLRMGVLGFGHGASVTVQAIERSNVFRAAVVVSPVLFSGMAEYGYIGMGRLRAMAPDLFGRELPQADLIRELRARESFLQIRRIRTPLLLIASDGDPSYHDQLRFIAKLREFGIEHRFLEYPGLFPDFLTAHDDASRPSHWQQSRDAAWGEVFSFLDEHLKFSEKDEVSGDAAPR